MTAAFRSDPVSAHAIKIESNSDSCCSRVLAAENACILSISASASEVPRLMDSPISRSTPLPCISGSAFATSVSVIRVENSRKKGLLARLRSPALKSTLSMSVVDPSTRVTVEVLVMVLPLPRSLVADMGVSEIRINPFSDNVEISPAWLMPSWFLSCQRPTSENASSSLPKTPSRFESRVRNASKPLRALRVIVAPVKPSLMEINVSTPKSS